MPASSIGTIRWSGLAFVAVPILAVLATAGCRPLPDDEAGLVLEDLAAGQRRSRLKERTPEPTRQPIAYDVEGRRYRGDLYHPGESPLAGIVLVPGAANRGKDDPRLVALSATLARARRPVHQGV